MRVVTFSEARNNLESILDQVKKTLLEALSTTGYVNHLSNLLRN